MSAVSSDLRERWSRSAKAPFERFRPLYPILVAALVLFVAAEQALEVRLADQVGRANAGRQGIAFVIMLVYIAMSLRFLKQRALSALLDLRPVVLIGDEAYDHHARAMFGSKLGIELGLVLAAMAIGVPLIMMDEELTNTVLRQPGGWGMLPLIAFTWVLMAWLLFSLIYICVRQARALGRLAQCPLAFNIYDPSNLLPFGRLSLWHGLVIAGLLMIPLILLGMPTQAGYLVVGVSILSLLAVFVPLWGVHEQLGKAKSTALAVINQQLLDAQAQFLGRPDGSAGELGPLSDRIAVLLTLRKAVAESPSWPFKSEAALIRTVIAAASPLIYFILNQLILQFWLSGSVP